MTTYPNLPDLDDERWAWSWGQNTPRRILTDAVGNELAEHQGHRPNDFDNIHESNLPFLAYQHDALAFDAGGTDAAKRRALAEARSLNQQIGTEAAYYTLIEINRVAGYHRYGPSGTKPLTTVEMFITPPIDRAADSDFIAYITDRAAKVWPYTLSVIAVHILSTASETVNVYTATSTIEYSGNWPYGS